MIMEKNMAELFWEDSYADFEVSTFGKPSKEIVDMAKILSYGAEVLDIGTGEGRNAIFVADKGLKVDAFDMLPNGIKKLNYISEKLGVNVNSFVCNIVDYQYPKKYDLIIAHGVLQFINIELRNKCISDMKEHTKLGGYNIIVIFTDVEKIPEDLAEAMVGVFQEGEIKEYYNDWEIVDYQSYIFRDEHVNGIKHTHSVNKLIVKKV